MDGIGNSNNKDKGYRRFKWESKLMQLVSHLLDENVKRYKTGCKGHVVPNYIIDFTSHNYPGSGCLVNHRLKDLNRQLQYIQISNEKSATNRELVWETKL